VRRCTGLSLREPGIAFGHSAAQGGDLPLAQACTPGTVTEEQGCTYMPAKAANHVVCTRIDPFARLAYGGTCMRPVGSAISIITCMGVSGIRT
jgi:hypothetical protein